MVTPFVFNPVAGNLLLDVAIADITSSLVNIAFDSFSGSTTSSRVIQAFGFANGDVLSRPGEGLRTEFVTSPVTVPEPGAWALLGAGLFALVAGAQRRGRA